jgi:murein DD-endopeptidase MepM/ murein hydrolase activator NlpD
VGATAALAGVLLAGGAAGAAALVRPDPVEPGAARAADPPAVPKPRIVFPFVGAVTQWHDDFQEARPIGHEEGNDVGAKPGSPVVAAIAGKIEHMWWGGGGWSVRITGANGDQVVYLHLGLNGKRATAFVPGIPDGARVTQGQQIGWSGYSGNASAEFPHVEFQFHPHGGGPVDPYAMLQAAPHLLFAAPKAAAGAGPATLQLQLQGVLTAAFAVGSVTSLRVTVDQATLSNGTALDELSQITLRLPAKAVVLRDGSPVTADQLAPGDDLTVQSAPLAPTLPQQLCFPNAIAAAQVDASSGAA